MDWSTSGVRLRRAAATGCTGRWAHVQLTVHWRRVPARCRLGTCPGRCTAGIVSPARQPPARRAPRATTTDATAASSRPPLESPQPPQQREARHREHTHRHRAQQQKNAIGMTDSAGRVRQPKQVRREEPEQERQRDRMCGRLGGGTCRAVRRDGAPRWAGWRGAGVGVLAGLLLATDALGTVEVDRAGAVGCTIRGTTTTGVVVLDVTGGGDECETCVLVEACGAGSGVCVLAEPGAFWGDGSAAPATLGTRQLSRSSGNRHQRPEWGGRASGPRTSVRLPPVPLPLTPWSCAQRPFQLSASYSAKLTIRLFVSRINDMRAAALSARAESRG